MGAESNINDAVAVRDRENVSGSGEKFTSARNTEARRTQHVLGGAAVTAGFLLAYTLLYWNRFLAPSAGVTSFYAAEQILQGKLPYRDFLFLTPPLHALKIALLIHLFGDRLVVPRFDGMIERVILGLILYFWLVRFFRVSAVAMGCIFGVLAFSRDGADSLANYHHDSVFWAVAAGFCASLYLDRRSPRSRALLAVGSGVFAGLCFATKQTTGMGVLAAIPALIGLLHARERKWAKAYRFAACFLVGWAVPVGALLAWLYHGSALGQFFYTVFLADSSKGNLYTILTRPFNQLPGLFTETLIGTALLAAFLVPFRNRNKPESPTRTIFIAAGISIALLLAAHSVYTGQGWPGNFRPAEPRFRHDLSPAPPLSALFTILHWGVLLLPITANALILLYLCTVYVRRPLSHLQAQLWLFAGLAAAIAYMLALSWQAYSPMALPGLALIVAAGIDRLEASSPPFACAVLACFCALVYCYVGMKLMYPYLWMYWREPQTNWATHQPTLPKLAGLLLSEPTLSYTETVARLIEAHSSPSDTVLVYPYFPVFYSLSNRQPATYVFNHYLDVCPDSICAADAEKLRASPPAVLVYMKEDEEEIHNDELIFRMGKPSGSRQIAKAIEDLASTYHEIYSFRVPGAWRYIYVYTRN